MGGTSSARKRENTFFAFVTGGNPMSRAVPVCSAWRRIRRRKEHPMLDLVLLALGLGFFALSVGYTVACDRL
jgi:hypothetical protein